MRRFAFQVIKYLFRHGLALGSLGHGDSMPPPQGHGEVIMERKPFDCPVSGEPCADGRCVIGRCYQQQLEATEHLRRKAADAEAEENEVRIEAEKIVREKLKALGDIRYQSPRYVAELAHNPKVVALARKRRAEIRALPEVKL